LRTIPKLLGAAVIGGGLGLAAMTGVASAQTGPTGPTGPSGASCTGPSATGSACTTLGTTATTIFTPVSVGSNTTGTLPTTGTNDLVLLAGAGLLTAGAVVTRRVVGARRN
jgi:LPXTG-motif cell wall-anchored protein